ncbi:hypothetical protein P170DRAFT_508985 [Aspergillus steynii IBT 23096]|uniref:Uncharacterized protein n=1 Tax=Aspergillus steynii IBT 23096 TaxID=1392250 RepID=A0A2I2GDJ9_9EURO|nr:uncharacterized protein P170DRAFT_508985 [Aspergillus steynii IBT 23096]PLB50911.1 hypothetical protein P170DRAFT_508985 [Aspergillus steynii IBT 23096]
MPDKSTQTSPPPSPKARTAGQTGVETASSSKSPQETSSSRPPPDPEEAVPPPPRPLPTPRQPAIVPPPPPPRGLGLLSRQEECVLGAPIRGAGVGHMRGHASPSAVGAEGAICPPCA